MGDIVEVKEAIPHLMVENLVADFFRKEGYCVVDIAYHHNIESKDYYALSRCYDLTALSYRTMADFICVKKQESFYLEIKVGVSPHKCFIEAYPLALHRNNAMFGVKCYYIYAGVITKGKMVFCPVEDIKAGELVLTNRAKGMEDILKESFPEAKVVYREARKGTSGDPFIQVDKSEIEKWKPIEEFWA